MFLWICLITEVLGELQREIDVKDFLETVPDDLYLVYGPDYDAELLLTNCPFEAMKRFWSICAAMDAS